MLGPQLGTLLIFSHLTTGFFQQTFRLCQRANSSSGLRVSIRRFNMSLLICQTYVLEDSDNLSNAKEISLARVDRNKRRAPSWNIAPEQPVDRFWYTSARLSLLLVKLITLRSFPELCRASGAVASVHGLQRAWGAQDTMEVKVR